MPLREKDAVDQEILDLIPERFDADPDSRKARSGARARSLLTVGLVAAALIATAATVWVIFFDTGDQAPSDVPVVKADEKPVKVRPVDPGGMDVPNRDKLVYDRLGGNASEPQVERLLPPPEAPKAPPVAAPAPSPVPVAPPPAMVSAPPQPAPVPAAPVVEAVPAAPLPAEPVVKPQPLPPPEPAVAAKPAAAAAAMKAVAGGGFLVQVAAMREQAAADREWARLSKTHADVLGGLAPDVVRADLGAKGIFYRLRAGPLDEAAAKVLCAELTKRKVGCLVVKR